MEKSKFNIRTLAVSGVLLALAFVLSFIKIFSWPNGGSVTACSMFFVTVIGYFYGPSVGLVSALAYAAMQFLQKPEAFSLLQVLFDYFFAFSALGISGFFSEIKGGLILGYSAGVFLRFVFSTLASLFFWSEYLEPVFNSDSMILAAVVYNASYILLEAAVTIIILALPPVRKGLQKLKSEANGERNR